MSLTMTTPKAFPCSLRNAMHGKLTLRLGRTTLPSKAVPSVLPKGRGFRRGLGTNVECQAPSKTPSSLLFSLS